MRLKAIIFLLPAVCFSSGLLAQEKPGLFAKIERVFQEKERAWEVERVYVKNSSDPSHESMVLRSGNNQAAVDVTVWKLEGDARDAFAGRVLAFSNTAGKGMAKRKLPSLGDEGHIWTNRGSAAWPTIMFRRGRVNVTVFAPTVATAKRFAKHIFEQIAAG